MTENEQSRKPPVEIEVAIELPAILTEPLAHPDGYLLNVGDTVQHAEYGTGKIFRLFKYENLEPVVYVIFENGLKKMLCVDIVKKVPAQSAEWQGQCMTESSATDQADEIDMVVEMPRIVDGPIVLADGTTLSIGDRVQHVNLGTGTIIRLFEYRELGPGVFVDFGNGVQKQIGMNFVKKTANT